MSNVLKFKNFFDDFECETKKIKFQNAESGIIRQFTINEMLYEINQARFRDWKEVKRENWQDAMEKWTEWRLYEKK